MVDGDEIIPLFDAPHLIKCIRNNLMTKDLDIDMSNEDENKGYATWEDLAKCYLIDKGLHTIRRQCSKLTDGHIVLTKIKKMKVKYCTQVFSATVASAIETYARTKCKYMFRFFT